MDFLNKKKEFFLFFLNQKKKKNLNQRFVLNPHTIPINIRTETENIVHPIKTRPFSRFPFSDNTKSGGRDPRTHPPTHPPTYHGSSGVQQWADNCGYQWTGRDGVSTGGDKEIVRPIS